jgi:hypothetical protein
VKRIAKNITNKKVTRRANETVPRMNDPIRIVPLQLPSELYRPSAGIAAPPAAQLTYRGGPLLGSVKVFPIFWGRVWQTSPNSDLANQINQFFRFVLGSGLIDQLAEYSLPAQTIGHGSFIGTVTIPHPHCHIRCRVDLVPARRSAAITTPSEALLRRDALSELLRVPGRDDEPGRFDLHQLA